MYFLHTPNGTLSFVQTSPSNLTQSDFVSEMKRPDRLGAIKKELDRSSSSKNKKNTIIFYFIIKTEYAEKIESILLSVRRELTLESPLTERKIISKVFVFVIWRLSIFDFVNIL